MDTFICFELSGPNRPAVRLEYIAICEKTWK